jgi:hypothetical protein
MKNEPLFKFIVAAGFAALVLAFASAARASDDKDITSTGSYTTSRGSSGTTSSSTLRSQGVVTRQGSWTNAAGRTGSWQSQATWDKDKKTASISGSATRPDGAKTTWQATRSRTAPGTISESGTITRENGKQSTFTATDTRVAPGSWDKQETITNADGKTLQRSVETAVADGKGTRKVTTTFPDGDTFTRNVTFARAPAQVPAPPASP